MTMKPKDLPRIAVKRNIAIATDDDPFPEQGT
jgi:hypothetical protein